MPPLNPEKRKQLILLMLGAGAAVSVLWFAAIRPLQASIAEFRTKTGEVQGKIDSANRAILLSDRFRTDFEAARRKLHQAEQGIAKGDVYRWIINTLLDFQAGFKEIELTDFEQPQIGELPMPPALPYRAATFYLSGIATYHQFGKFLAAFENRFSYIRLQNLQLEPANTVQNIPEAPGKLNFKMQLLLLVSTNSVAEN